MVVRRWELSYAMMSVALDDALSMRARGELVCARQQVSITSELLQRFATVFSDCNILADKGRSVSDLPAVEPLKAEFFRGMMGGGPPAGANSYIWFSLAIALGFSRS